jgi:hypothetical protein
LSAEELRELLSGLGYPLTPETILRTVDYYLARTTHGSTLSRVVDAWVLARSDRRRSWSAFTDALAADVADTQGGTTAGALTWERWPARWTSSSVATPGWRRAMAYCGSIRSYQPSSASSTWMCSIAANG